MASSTTSESPSTQIAVAEEVNGGNLPAQIAAAEEVISVCFVCQSDKKTAPKQLSRTSPNSNIAHYKSVHKERVKNNLLDNRCGQYFVSQHEKKGHPCV